MKYKTVIKNSIMLYGMTAAKMIFPFLTLPYLTRVLTLDVYGGVAYVKSMMSFLQVVIDFGFMLSGTKEIVENRKDKEKVGKIIGNIMVARIFIFFFIFLATIGMCFYLPILSEFKLYTILSLGTIFLSIFLFDYLFRGIEKMEIITSRFVLMKGISTVLTFVFVKKDSDIIYIPILDLLGSFVAVIFVLKEIKKIGIKIQISKIKQILNELKTSCIYFVSNMATTLFTGLNTLIIGVFLSAEEIAYWSVCMQLINGIQALYTPVSDAVYPEMIKTKNITLIKKISLIFFPILIMGCIFTYFTSGYFLEMIAGKRYSNASDILRLLIPVLFFGFYSILYGWPALGAIKKQKHVMVATISAASFQFIGLLLLAFLNSFSLIYIAILRSITECILFSFRFIFCLYYRREFQYIRGE